MTIGEAQNIRTIEKQGGRSQGQSDPSLGAASNREIARAVREINEGGGVGPSSELRFSIDRDSGRPLIRIVDRVTDEVITQIPPQAMLRIAEMIKTLGPGDRFA